MSFDFNHCGYEMIFHAFDPDQQKAQLSFRAVQEVNLEGFSAKMILEPTSYKSGAEIKAMRVAAQASVAAHRRAMELCRPGMTEYEVEAELLHAFMHHGCRWPAYPPIVAGGANACILHYTENAAVLRKGDLLLIDAAAEHECYAADITRTRLAAGAPGRPCRRAVPWTGP